MRRVGGTGSFLIGGWWSRCERLSLVGCCGHGLSSVAVLHRHRLVGGILGRRVGLWLSRHYCRLLGVLLRSGGHHCGVGGGGNHRLWLAAYLVQAAAGTDTAADDDEQEDDKAPNTKDHGQW